MADVSRQEIDRFIAGGEVLRAQTMLGQLWRASPQLATASFVVSRFEQLREKLDLTPCRLAILRSFTLEPVVPLLRAAAFAGGIDLEVRLGGFNTYSQDILDGDGWLYAYAPQVVILAVQTRDVAPGLWAGDEKGADECASDISRKFESLVDFFRARSAAHVIMHSLERPSRPTGEVVEGGDLARSDIAVGRINTSLAKIAAERRNVYILDYNRLIAERGRENWHDERKWLSAAMPIAAGELIYLAREWLRYLHPITGRICKVLAVDLDNTLWGGVIGEDGIDGIQLGDKPPGAAYRELQQTMLDLHRRGILLAVCSKNNPADAMQVITKHPGMLLRAENFAAMRINWDDKAANLRSIAGELNVGIDSIAFLDDNPVEREWVREAAPEVTVIDLPADPMLFSLAVRQSPVFERLELTEEDAARGEMYNQQKSRNELQNSSASLEDFYRSLQMRIRIAPMSNKTLARAAQLTQKTNQFNLTTRRYGEEQLAAMIRDVTQSPAAVFTLQVIDRFGDNGIVGVAILGWMDNICEIDTFLLSCRVIGRTVETALLAELAGQASRAGATTLAGWFIPTNKNAPASGFYAQHGFRRIREKDGASYWELELANHSITTPTWITVEEKSA